jgi:hypothetical protein
MIFLVERILIPLHGIVCKPFGKLKTLKGNVPHLVSLSHMDPWAESIRPYNNLVMPNYLLHPLPYLFFIF